MQEPLIDDEEDALELPDLSEGLSYYQLLNLDADCSTQDVVKAHRALAVALHPDKQDEQHREIAEAQFRRIQRAYEVLVDPRLRAVYDVLGEEGLSQKWDVGQKLKSPAEMRADFENQVRKRKIDELENLVRTKVETSIGVDGTSIFAPSSAFREGQSVFLQRWHNIRAHTMTLKNSFELPFNSATKLAFTTNTSVQRLRSAGSSSSMSAQLRHRFSSKLNLTATTAVFKPHTTSIKVNYVPDSDSFITLAAASRTLARPPPLTLAFGRNIYKGMTSFVTLKTGTYSLGLWGSSERLSQTVPSLSLGLTSLKGWGLNMDTSVEGTSVSADWSHKPTKDSKIRLGALLTVTGGFNLSATGEHRIPYDSWLALVVSCGSQGLILRIRWRRLGQLLVVPVVLSREPEFLLAMQLLAVPAISVTLLQHAYLLPRKKRKLQARLEELQKEHADQIEEQRKEANQVQLMLADQVRRRTTTEKSKDGLIIHSAWYGAIDGPERIDVRIPLQVLVQNSQLVIPGGRSKSGLLGFYDPCPGQPKQLTLEYEFGTRQHRITYADRDAVTLPLRLHLVD